MFERLQKKWGVSAGRLVLILLTFAVGGSRPGIAGKWIMSQLGISSTALYIPIYIIIITIIWPVSVLAISVLTGQLPFFKQYLVKMGRRMASSKHALTKEGFRASPDEGRVQSSKSDSLKAAGDNSKPQTPNPKHLFVFASGAGSNAQRIIDHFRNSDIATVSVIVCNKPGAGVTQIAEKENIPVLLIEKERFFRGDAYLPELKNADLIILAGFLWKIPQALINAFPRRIVNIHPALLPKYGGKGMYGQYVHEAVINAGEVQSGITIHYVDEHYDHGDVIFQTGCPVLPGDTPEKLAGRIHQLEHLHYPQVIGQLIANSH
jgi:formyltetrahydrofolate-dependent phosphoribosylglycinamide formyltransferase